MLKCNTCGGTYEPIQRDGSQYFHACPPLSVAELKTGLQTKTVSLPADAQARVDAAGKLTDATDTPAAAAARVDAVLAALTVERPNKRDENIVGAGIDGAAATPKAAGAGTTKL